MAPIYRQFIPEPQSRAASQWKQLYPSLPMAHSVHLKEDYTRLQNGVIPYGPSRRFHEISLFPLPQGQYNENMMGDYIWGLF